MSRIKRIYYENAVYHVAFRGNNRHMILKSKSEKADMLASIQQCQERKKFKIYGFVLMDNHGHMILEVSHIHNISKVMQSILLSYSTKYRRKNDYSGHVWQGRFFSRPIMDDVYMKECLEYMHNNPVKAEMVPEACDYLYSSARFYEGQKAKGVYDFIELSRFGDSSAIK